MGDVGARPGEEADLGTFCISHSDRCLTHLIRPKRDLSIVCAILVWAYTNSQKHEQLVTRNYFTVLFVDLQFYFGLIACTLFLP